jgi:hypothetical protein
MIKIVSKEEENHERNLGQQQRNPTETVIFWLHLLLLQVPIQNWVVIVQNGTEMGQCGC